MNWNKRAWPFFLCLLSVLLLLNVSACGKNPATSQSASPNSPSGIGATPESGIANSLVAYSNGHSESIMSANGITYVGSDNETLYAFRSTTGQILWQHRLDGQVVIYAISDGTIYAVSGTNYDVVYALNTSTGSLLWHHQIDSIIFGMVVIKSTSSSFSDTGQPVVANGAVYVGDIDGTIYALQASTGKLLWQQQEGNSVFRPLSVANGLVIANTQGFRLANPCYERARAAGKKPAWSTMGQETSFAQSHTLLLATTGSNSIRWASQLQSLPGVIKIESPFQATC